MKIAGKGASKLVMVLMMALTVGLLSGCGNSHAVKKELSDGVTVAVSIHPYPIGVMEREKIQLDFTLRNSPVDVSGVKVRMDMVGMAMGDKLKLAQQNSGVYQSGYEFSMPGKWTESVEFVYNGKTDKAQIPIEVNQ